MRAKDKKEEGERHMRIPEFCQETGYKESTVRKKILTRQLGYRKVGRLILIPESELKRLMGEYRPPVLT